MCSSVGTSDGDTGLWEVSSGEKLLSRKFRVWKIKNISKTFLVYPLVKYITKTGKSSV